MHKERIKENIRDRSLGYTIAVLLVTLTLLVTCGIVFYYLGIMLPIALWQSGHPVLAVLQFYIAFISLIYGGSKS
jgi:heme A synthase